MSRSEKRRKAWVNIHDGGDNGDYATAWLNRKAAKTNSGVRVRAVAVSFIERRRGDVVLSREQVEVKATEIAQDLVAEGFDVEDAPTFIRCVVRALLRGGRR